MKVFVNQEKCIGCGNCVNVCPDVFELRDDKSVAKEEFVPAEHASACVSAASQCPVDAILVE